MSNCRWPTVQDMLGMRDDEVARVDPVVMNLVVASGIPSLADLDIGRYVQIADAWADDIRRYLPAGDANFYRTPERWQNDLDFSRLALMGWYIGSALDARYLEDQRNIKRIHYTDPTHLFLCGVMDTRRGTCASMPALYVALGGRLNWPLSLACVGSHYICRFDNGQKTFNIEATVGGEGHGFSSPPDHYYRSDYRVPQCAIDCGSDLRALSPREMFGVFLGLRARHYENTGRFAEAESDYLLARYLFRQNRQLYYSQNQVSVQNSADWFEPGERGHPTELAMWLQQLVSIAPWKRKARPQAVKEPSNVRDVDAFFQELVVC